MTMIDSITQNDTQVKVEKYGTSVHFRFDGTIVVTERGYEPDAVVQSVGIRWDPDARKWIVG